MWHNSCSGVFDGGDVGVVFAMEVASYGSPLVGKTLLLHVTAISLRICPNHPCLP